MKDIEKRKCDVKGRTVLETLYCEIADTRRSLNLSSSLVSFDTKMLDIFRSLKSLIKISHIHIDSPVFRLHYSLTVILLIAFSLIVTTRQYVGNPIDCIHSKDLPEDVLNTYCWIHSTYTITAAYRKKEGSEVPFPGIDNSKSYPESERKEYRYYQWVCFMLFLQVTFHFLHLAFSIRRIFYRQLFIKLLAFIS